MLTEKAICASVDATWHGYLRALFCNKIAEIVNEESTHALYLEVKRSGGKTKKDRFIGSLGKSGFIGTVCFNALRIYYGD